MLIEMQHRLCLSFLVVSLKIYNNPPELGSYTPYSSARVNESAALHQEAAVNLDQTCNLEAMSRPLHHRATRPPSGLFSKHFFFFSLE